MKFFTISLILSFFLQSTIAMACQSHDLYNKSSSQPATHCHSPAGPLANQEKGKTQNSSDCPVCELKLCIQDQNILIQDSLLKLQKLEVTKIFVYSFLSVFSLAFELQGPTASMQSNLVLPQHKNWQAFYSVFLD